MSENRFIDEFSVHFSLTTSWEIYDSIALTSFRNVFNDEIQLAENWGVALKEINFGIKIEHIVKGEKVVFSVKGYEITPKMVTEINMISRPKRTEIV